MQMIFFPRHIMTSFDVSLSAQLEGNMPCQVTVESVWMLT